MSTRTPPSGRRIGTTEKRVNRYGISCGDDEKNIPQSQILSIRPQSGRPIFSLSLFPFHFFQISLPFAADFPRFSQIFFPGLDSNSLKNYSGTQVHTFSLSPAEAGLSDKKPVFIRKGGIL